MYGLWWMTDVVGVWHMAYWVWWMTYGWVGSSYFSIGGLRDRATVATALLSQLAGLGASSALLLLLLCCP